MNVNLGTQWETFIDKNVKSGRYVSASEVVREGLRLLQEKEQVRQLKIAGLRNEVAKGLESLDHGDYLELDAKGMKAYLEGVNKRGRERLGRKKEAAKR